MVGPSAAFPRQGELWWFDPDPVRGTELGKKVRPALVVSVDSFNRAGPRAVVVPATSRDHRNPLHVPFTYHLRGSEVTTYFCCDNLRSIDARVRLVRRIAPRPVPAAVMSQVQRIVRMIFGL